MERLILGLLTYLVHSTVLLGLAALLRFGLRERRLALQEAVLRVALVGGVLTAGLQVGLGLQPLGGVLQLPSRSGAAPLLADGSAAVIPTAPAVSRATPEGPSAGASAPSRAGSVEAWRAPAARLWRPALVAGWGLLALLALCRLAVAARRLRWLLRDRRPLERGEVGWQTLAIAAGLGLRRPLRLSTAPHLTVPLATGVLRPEVCLPERVMQELPAGERSALCAHELAHVARRDPAWILLARLMEAVAPLQPLNGWARRRLQDLAECLSDDLAVSACAGPLDLARSLVDVASWAIVSNPVPPALAAGALSAHSRLGHRVERLMDPLRTLERPRRFLLPLAAAAVAALALLMPVVSGSARQETVKPALAPQEPPEATPERAAAIDERSRASDDQRRLVHVTEVKRLTEKVERRSRQREAEMKRLAAELEAIASEMAPSEQELKSLGSAMEDTAREMAELQAVRAQEQAAKDHQLARVRPHLAEVAEVKARLSEEEVRKVREEARAMAERARLSQRELRELQRATAELARQSLPELAGTSGSASRAIAQAREELRRAQEQVQRASAELKRAIEEARRADEEAQREKR